MSSEITVLSADHRLRGRITREDGPNGTGWNFSIDWLRPDGTRDTDIDAYEYGTVYDADSGDAHAQVIRVVDDILRDFKFVATLSALVTAASTLP